VSGSSTIQLPNLAFCCRVEATLFRPSDEIPIFSNSNHFYREARVIYSDALFIQLSPDAKGTERELLVYQIEARLLFEAFFYSPSVLQTQQHVRHC
jgi:hypothetical protein